MNIDLIVEARDLGRKSELNKMRTDGFIPGIINSAGKEGIPIKLEKNTFLKQYKKTIGELVFFDLKLAGNTHRTVIKEKQIDPVSREMLHVDFHEFAKDKKITVNLPLRFEGSPIGVKNGGGFDVIVREISVSCLPDDLDEDIEINISELDIGDSIHVGDLDLAKYDVLIAPDITIAVVHPPQSLVEEEEAADSEETEGEGTESEETEG